MAPCIHPCFFGCGEINNNPEVAARGYRDAVAGIISGSQDMRFGDWIWTDMECEKFVGFSLKSGGGFVIIIKVLYYAIPLAAKHTFTR